MVRIYERGRDSVRFVFMGNVSAKRLVANMEELVSKSCSESFVRMIREGHTVFFLQRCSNSKGNLKMRAKWASLLSPREGVIVDGVGLVLSCTVSLALVVPLATPIIPVKTSEATVGPRDGQGSFAKVVVSGREGAGKERGKGKEIVLGGFPDFMENSQPKLNVLTLNMEKMRFGKIKKDSGMVQVFLNIQLQYGLECQTC